MSFLFGNAAFLQDIENGFALYLKLSGQIINSNFHPLCVSSKHPLHDHDDLTV